MTRNDIATELCNSVPEIQKSTALHVVDNLTNIFADAFSRGENIYLRGFGTFEVKETKEKKARNIAAGTTITIPAGRTVKFKLSKQLKEQMNNGTVD